MNMIGWALKLEAANPWLYELLLFIVICPMIIYTGKRNARTAGPEGYSYGRAVGFVFAMMMFTGIVYGVGRFLMINFVGAEYYSPLIEEQANIFIRGFSSNEALFDAMIAKKEFIISLMKNPFLLIIGNIVDLVIKGGFLGLILCAFVYTKPDIFAQPTPAPEQKVDDKSGSEPSIRDASSSTEARQSPKGGAGKAEGDNIKEDEESGSE